jgi:hypothetical protein
MLTAASILGFVSSACTGDGNDAADVAVDLLVPPDLGEEVSLSDTVITLDVPVTPDISSDSADTTADASIEPGAFLAPCQGNADCLSGYCVEGEDGYFCTQVCTLDCPGGFDCRSVVIGSGDPVFLCLPRLQRTCTPCQADYQCPGGACLDLDDGRRCAPTCVDETECGQGYACVADPSGLREGSFCQPKSGACDCTPDSAGMQRTCLASNDAGTCPGVESCDPEVGWVGCNARIPEDERCDGFDNNCNAFIDEGFELPEPCVNEVEGIGSCNGLRVCAGSLGLVCNARTPAAEACDFVDNDCDDATDEDFKDAEGAFTRSEHCGTCNNSCDGRIPNGTGTCAADGTAQPVCVVAECDPDYVPIGRFQCGLPPDVSCQPCVGDSDCFGGTCTEVDGQRVCLSPCGGAGGSCQEGYACEDLEAGRRCVPVTGSCVCNASTDGQRRTCNSNNDFGVCFGQELCDGDSGWTGCTARVPAAETCNGIDDDCNGRVDDGVTPPTAACERTVAGVGTCRGTWFCNDFDGSGTSWQCSAPAPGAEVCDFLDNDCEGTADQTFRNAAGLYVSNDHCGSCGITCDGAIPNATARCGVANGRPRCEVASCDPGFYQAGPTTCLAVGENLCAPCVTDANCGNPGDRCLASADGSYCGRDCGAGNVHGLPAGVCPEGFSCDDVGGSMQCRPTSGSCSCLPDDVGRTRTCLSSNDVGTCFGQELCVADAGWSSCSARTPGAERCNTFDDDCNGAVDDVAGRGGACTISNGFGTCQGLLDCGDGSDTLMCVGQTPAAETCNYNDDDCDGTVDEGFAGLFSSCSEGVGACQRFGFLECRADGTGTRCNAVPGDASAEICDGVDNNCNGRADESADGRWDRRGQPCSDGLGVCRVAGVEICTADGSALRCSATAPAPTSSERCNNLDDDCDGATDEAFPDKNGVCSVGQGLCLRFGTNVCTGDGAGLACSATEGQGTNEICDLLDNDCDGNTDEDFRSNGIYGADQACGNCFTNCRQIFANAANAYGTCAVNGQQAGCQLTCCKPGDPLCGGGSGDFYNLNGVPEDGCEFRLDPSAIYVSESDGRDDAGCGLGPVATGGGRYPCKSLVEGQARAVALGRARVLVAGGAYYGNIAMAEGVSLLGGHNAVNWQRSPAANLTAIFGTQTSGHRVTVAANNIRTTATEISGFAIYGEVASGVAENSYAVFVSNSNDRLTIRDNTIWPGRGGPGQAGTRGSDGASGGAGANGAAAYEIEGAACAADCAGTSNPGGAAGVNAACPAANGGAGGKSDCPDFNENSNLCETRTLTAAQTNTNNGLAGSGTAAGAGGSGGCDSLISSPSGGNGGTSCNCGFVNLSACPTGTFSDAGRNGGSGSAGAAGARSADTLGSVTAGHWRGVGGGGGIAGTHGSGGGGGGGGGGVETWYGSGQNRCSSMYTDFGGSGGGGGAGGCGSAGGTGGGAGGGAFGIFVNLGGQTTAPVVSGNTLNQGTGGVGGRGGDGGVPGLGGNGGDGGAGGDSGGTAWCAKPGSKGGEGGSGGAGGGGAGGNGGVAYNVWVVGQGSLSLATWTNANTWNSNGAGGAGGAGGGAAPGGAGGQSGQAGATGLRNW